MCRLPQRHVMAAVTVIQILLVYFGGEIFRTTPLPLRDLWLVMALSATVVPFDLLRKAVLRRTSGG